MESALNKSKWFVFSALAVANTLGAGAARAGHGPDVQWSVTIGTPATTRPAPVVAQPHPVYRVGAPFDGPHSDQRFYREPTHWDRDGDGIPNRHDRVYNPRWDVDGDGIPNRHDRDRDGDGTPNRHDRHDGRTWRR
jgi:hypothetical protein